MTTAHSEAVAHLYSPHNTHSYSTWCLKKYIILIVNNSKKSESDSAQIYTVHVAE